MKEKYSKPAFVMESFTLTQSVANSCGWTESQYVGRPTHVDQFTCGWDDGYGEVYWFDGVTDCTTEVDEDFEYEEICYNAPTGTATIFAS